MQVDFLQHIQNLLSLAASVVSSNRSLIAPSHKTNTKQEVSAEIDLKLEQVLLDYLKKHQLPVKIYSEEIGEVVFDTHPTHYLAFDPLDGTVNFRYGKDLLPYGLLIALYDNPQPKIGDVALAAACEFTTQTQWLFDGHTTFDHAGNKASLTKTWSKDISTPVYFDLHATQGYQVYANVSQHFFIRNTGSTIANLNLLLANTAAAIAIPKQKAEEVGAIWGLVKGAGGTIVDFQGASIDRLSLDPAMHYQVLAGHPKIVKQVSTLLA